MPKPGQIITVAGNYRQYDQARETTASGLRWENIGEIRPIAMPELECEPLAAALKDKTRFSRAEWAEFGIEETLTYRHYIQSGPVFFKPVEGDDASNASDDHGETQPLRCSPSPSRMELTHTGARQVMIRRATQTRQNEGRVLTTCARKMISSAAESKGTDRVHQTTDRTQASHRLTGPCLVLLTRRSAPHPASTSGQRLVQSVLVETVLVEHFLRAVCFAARELRRFLSGTDACREMCTTSAKARLACRQNAAGKWAWCCQRTMLTSIMLLLSCISARLQAIETRPRQIQIRMTMRR